MKNSKIDKKYELTRSIGFYTNDDNFLEKNTSIGQDWTFDEADFIENLNANYGAVIDIFQELFRRDSVFKPMIEIRKEWLKIFMKATFYEHLWEKDGKNQCFPTNDRFISQRLDDWLNNSRNIQKQVASLCDLKKQQTGNSTARVRYSDLAHWIRVLNSKDNVGFVLGICRPGILKMKNKEDDRLYRDFRSSCESLNQLLSDCEKQFSAISKHGHLIHRASFNRYTVGKINKTPTDSISLGPDLDKLKERARDEAKHGNYKFDFDIDSINSITDFYTKIKYWKSEQKRLFLEAVDENFSTNDLLKEFPLFKTDKDKLNDFIDLSNKIKKESNKSEREPLVKKRGEYYRRRFATYKNFCNNVFKPAAKKFGEHNARIRAIEKEKNESLMLDYFASIFFDEESRCSLILVPEPKINEFMNSLSRFEHTTVGAKNSITIFNSLTVEALNRLIDRNIPKEKKNFDNVLRKIAVYQNILRGNIEKIKLDLSGFDANAIQEVANKRYDKADAEESFRSDLHRVAYSVTSRTCSMRDIDILMQEFDIKVLKLESYDLNRQSRLGDDKDHTELWNDFWSKDNLNSGYKIRLNPEVSLLLRPQSCFCDESDHHNRFCKDQLSVRFTMTQNAAQVAPLQSYSDTEKIREYIEHFNSELDLDYSKQDVWYYGIDRGSQELATLGIVRWENGDSQKPVYAEIKTYKLKDEFINKTICPPGYKNEIVAWKNPSYFVDGQTNYFDESTSSFIDLTTAKVIKGKIILNGDVSTLINLKIANAKRQLFENIDDIDPGANIEFNQSEKKFFIKLRDSAHDSEKFLPYYIDDLWKYESLDCIKTKLQQYLDQLRASTAEIPTIDQINNLRDSITANMIGIIHHLYATYRGYIVLEDLDAQNLNNKFNKSNEDISRRLEWALYRKFQHKGLVPPRLRQSIFIRGGDQDKSHVEQDEKLKQIGIIRFEPEGGTSKVCPKCEKCTKQNKKTKLEERLFICNQCKYRTDEEATDGIFNKINGPDDVAAYNIAKIGSGLQLKK